MVKKKPQLKLIKIDNGKCKNKLGLSRGNNEKIIIKNATYNNNLNVWFIAFSVL